MLNNNNSSDFELTIRQQPERARVAGGKEKGASLSLLLLSRTTEGPRMLTEALGLQSGSPLILHRSSNFA
jgi:hypothetical protein